jgi:hypothetical protein
MPVIDTKEIKDKKFFLFPDKRYLKEINDSNLKIIYYSYLNDSIGKIEAALYDG